MSKTLTFARAMQLEGESFVQPVLDGIRHLPWGMHYDGQSKELIEALLPQIEPLITADDLTLLFDAMARSPGRIGNAQHPGLSMLSDMLTPEMVSIVVDWTEQELKNLPQRLWPRSLNFWPPLMADVPAEIWDRLAFLLDYACDRLMPPGTNSEIVEATVKHAPWSLAGPIVSRISVLLSNENARPDLLNIAASSVSDDLLQREDTGWRASAEGQEFVSALRHLATKSSNQDYKAFLEILSSPDQSATHSFIGQQLLDRLLATRERAVGRKDTRKLAFGVGAQTFFLGPISSIDDSVAVRAANALNDIWAAENALAEEVEDGTLVAGYLLRASTGEGNRALVRSILDGMSSRRTAIEIFGIRKECAWMAWKHSSPHSVFFGDEFLPALAGLLNNSPFNLPLDVADAQARFATELILRARAPRVQQAGLSALQTIRGRCFDRLRWGARALVAALGRLVEESSLTSKHDALLEFLLPWIEQAASAPVARTRKEVAFLCVRLIRLKPDFSAVRLGDILYKLRTDVRQGVRSAGR